MQLASVLRNVYNACEANEEIGWQEQGVFHSLDETSKYQRLLLLNL